MSYIGNCIIQQLDYIHIAFLWIEQKLCRQLSAFAYKLTLIEPRFEAEKNQRLLDGDVKGRFPYVSMIHDVCETQSMRWYIYMYIYIYIYIFIFIFMFCFISVLSLRRKRGLVLRLCPGSFSPGRGSYHGLGKGHVWKVQEVIGHYSQ